MTSSSRVCTMSDSQTSLMNLALRCLKSCPTRSGVPVLLSLPAFLTSCHGEADYRYQGGCVSHTHSRALLIGLLGPTNKADPLFWAPTGSSVNISYTARKKVDRQKNCGVG